MYDIIIIGAGAGGLTSAIYAKEANKSVLILEKMGAGGQMQNINEITNYPGYKKISGYELSENMRSQAVNLGAEIKREEVVSVDFSNKIKKIKTHKNEYESKNVIIATGAYAKPLDLSNEKEYLGKGLSYCATCDGNFFKNKTVAVVGGGNTSFDDCLYLYNLASKIYLIHRRDTFTANDKFKNKLDVLIQEDSNKIEILKSTVVTKLIGDKTLSGIEILNKKNNHASVLNIDGLFVAIGRRPDTEFLNKQLKLDEKGFIITNENMETNVQGVYAIGDVRNTPLRQIVTACSDGAIAVSTIIKNNVR